MEGVGGGVCKWMCQNVLEVRWSPAMQWSPVWGESSRLLSCAAPGGQDELVRSTKHGMEGSGNKMESSLSKELKTMESSPQLEAMESSFPNAFPVKT